MKLYKNSDGVWAGTQADARKYLGLGWWTVDVPVDKPNLLQFLNVNKVGSAHTSNGNDMIKAEEDMIDERNTKSSMSWFRWAYDCMCRGQYDDAKEMLRKGLIDDRTTTSDG